MSFVFLDRALDIAPLFRFLAGLKQLLGFAAHFFLARRNELRLFYPA